MIVNPMLILDGVEHWSILLSSRRPYGTQCLRPYFTQDFVLGYSHWLPPGALALGSRSFSNIETKITLDQICIHWWRGKNFQISGSSSPRTQEQKP